MPALCESSQWTPVLEQHVRASKHSEGVLQITDRLLNECKEEGVIKEEALKAMLAQAIQLKRPCIQLRGLNLDDAFLKAIASCIIDLEVLHLELSQNNFTREAITEFVQQTSGHATLVGYSFVDVLITDSLARTVQDSMHKSQNLRYPLFAPRSISDVYDVVCDEAERRQRQFDEAEDEDPTPRY